MINLRSSIGLVGLTLGLILTGANVALADRQQMSPGRPLNLSGTSGGNQNSGDCGYIQSAPNHVIDVTTDLSYWRITVRTQGSPTLLIDGPTGRYCVLPENAAGTTLLYSGYGATGTYNIFVGDRKQGQHPYNLSISDQR